MLYLLSGYYLVHFSGLKFYAIPEFFNYLNKEKKYFIYVFLTPEIIQVNVFQFFCKRGVIQI